MQGLTLELIEQFISASAIIDKAKRERYAIQTNRKGVVQNNLTKFDDLHKQLKEILSAGIIL